MRYRETQQEFQSRMLDQMRDLGFVIPQQNFQSGKWIAVRDSVVDRAHEKSGRFKFDTAYASDSPVCIFRSMKRDLPTDFKRGDISVAFATGYSKARPAQAAARTYTEPTLAERLTLNADYREQMQPAVEKTLALWNSSHPALQHGYLAEPAMGAGNLRETVDGDLLVPVFRPGAPDLSKTEIAGAQLINKDGFKQFLMGTKSGGGFTLIPSHPNPDKWLAHLKQSDKPLVMCEGVGTALAIYQATGYPVVACLSAKNLPLVAEWLKHEGHTLNRDVVICADNDLDTTRVGLEKRDADKFIGIKEACKAAEITGGKVALVDTDQRGYDARDLLRDKGSNAVVELISAPRSIDEIKRDRPEVFGLERAKAIVEEEEMEVGLSR